MKKKIERHWLTPVPEWCRLQWHSQVLRQVWEPRMQHVGAEWHAAERLSVGLSRSVALQVLSLTELAELSKKTSQRHLHLTVLEETGVPTSYTAGSINRGGGARVVLSRNPSIANRFIEAWKEGDQEEIGALLGFPECCTSFFAKVWTEQNWRDTSWPMTGMPDHPLVNGHAGIGNILLRWVGVRYIPHLPCSLTCEETLTKAASFRELFQPHQQSWADELLSQPIEWSAVNGIAEIKTPLFTISAKTDSMQERKTIQLKGDTAAGSPVGLAFPFSYLEAKPVEDLWTANGFKTELPMLLAHDDLMGLVHAIAATTEPLRTVIDIGCGNGVLLDRVSCAKRIGIEHDQARAAKAMAFGLEILENELEAVTSLPQSDLVFLMPGRLTEISEDQAKRLVSMLQDTTRHLVVYTYDSPEGGLTAMIGKTTLAKAPCVWAIPPMKTDNIEAGVLKWVDHATTT